MKPNNRRPMLLLVSSQHCPHCKRLHTLLESDALRPLYQSLSVKFIESNPELAKQYHIRSAPWLQIDKFELTGALNETELRDWLARAQTSGGMRAYLSHLFLTGQLNFTIDYVHRHPECFSDLVDLMADAETPLQVRIGITAVFEHFEGDAILQHAWGSLVNRVYQESDSVRADLVYLIALIKTAESQKFLLTFQNDPSLEVRDIVIDAQS